MPELAFEVLGAGVAAPAAGPQLAFRVRVDAGDGVEVRSAVLDVQVRIALGARAHGDPTRARLAELLGAPEQWGRSPQSLLWTRTTRIVPGFTGSTEIDLVIACTHDFEVATAKYLHGLRDAEVPLELLFGGTVFYGGPGGALRTALIPWESEARYRLPAALWRQAMDVFFPASAWLRLSSDAFDRLWQYRTRRALPSWEATIDRLLTESSTEELW